MNNIKPMNIVLIFTLCTIVITNLMLINELLVLRDFWNKRI